MNRLSKIALAAAMFLTLPISRSPRADEAASKAEAIQKEMSLAVGESETISTADVTTYSVGTPGVAGVRLGPDRFIVDGLKAGSTSLVLLKKDSTEIRYLINVFAQKPEIVEGELQTLLDGYTGLRVRRVGSRLFIDGGVATEADQKRIEQIARIYKGQVESLVTVGSTAVDRKLNIRIDLFVVQYKKSSGYTVGISWPGRIGGGTAAVGVDIGNGGVTAQAALVNQPLPGLDIASNNGWAKVLKQAMLLTMNGSEADFHNGEEVNVPVTTGMVAGVQKVSFGTSVRVLPRYDPKTRNIEVQVTADVSDRTTPDALPNLQSSRIKTNVFLPLGQSLVLSGFHARSQKHQTSGLPLLSEIPGLGVLFGSHGDAQEEVEGSIILVPSVLDSIDRSGADIVNDALAEYEKYDGDPATVNAFPERPPAPPARPAPAGAPAKKAR